MSFASMKYKDASPLKTIGAIRDILGGLGLFTFETGWRNSLAGYFSVNVRIAGTELSTNGKGTSAEFALASAYGEMMERLQNFCTFRLSFDLSPEALRHRGFYYAPDEKLLSTADLLTSGEEWINQQLARLGPGVDLDRLLRQWQAVSYEEVPADFIALPFLNLHSGNISHIPLKMVSKMYMSNGMCAGNTPAEALVQGVSEVFERHVNKKIVQEKLTPPTIPRAYTDRFPHIAAMLSAIEASGDSEVVVKDCSLGRGYPVVGVIYVNRVEQSYFVKFGAHPRFEIAAERTLTELLQGQDIGRMKGLREFSFAEGRDPGNLMGILVHGSGVYPSEFFGAQPSWEFRPWTDVPAADNRELLTYLLTLLTADGFQLFARDVSFLGFPSFQVIVPGLSEVEEFGDSAAISDYGEYNQARRLLYRLAVLTDHEREALTAFLSRLPHGPQTTALDFLNLPGADQAVFPWYYGSLDLLLAALHYRQGSLGEAAAAFGRFADFFAATAGKGAALIYYKCVHEFLEARAAGRPPGEIAATLRLFYPEDVVRGVLGEFADSRPILHYQGNLPCFACGECSFRNHCLHPAGENVYRALKDRYAVAAIDQAALRNLMAGSKE
jgi:ribosomal protein S12 methylthiotransferase accessory factor